MAHRQRGSIQSLRPTFERLEPRHMLSLSAALTAALTEASAVLPIEPRTLQTPLRLIELPYSVVPVLPPVEQPYFVEPELPPTTEPEAPQQVDSVLLALHGDGFFIVEGRHGQQLYTRVGDFLINDQHELVTKDGLRLLGYVANDEWEIVPELAPLVVSYGQEVSQETSTVSFSGVLNPSVGVGAGTSTDFVVYDELGNEIDLNITAVLSAKNADSTEYRWTVNYAPGTGLIEKLGSGIISFDGNGDVVSGALQSFLVGQDAGTISIELNFSQVKALGEVDAQGNPISSLNVTRQDGFPPGLFQAFIITGTGEIHGQFTNGMQRLLGQLQLAAIADPHGLRRVAENLYAVTSISGEPRLGEPYSSALGSLTQLPPGYTVTEEGYFLRENESPPEPSPSWQPSPSGLRYPWQLRSVNLELEGQELFIVEGTDGTLLYTPDGQFHLNTQQQLVTRDGLRVLGTGPDGTQLGPLTIPLGSIAARATQQVQFSGNLNLVEDVASDPGIFESQTLSVGTTETPELSGLTFETVPAPMDKDGIGPGIFQYYFTFFDAASNVESASAVGQYQFIAKPNQGFLISGLPQAKSSQLLSLRIYRSASSSRNVIHLVDELPPGTTSYVDSLSNSQLLSNRQLFFNRPLANEDAKLVDVRVNTGTFLFNRYRVPFKPGELSLLVGNDYIVLTEYIESPQFPGRLQVPELVQNQIERLIQNLRDRASSKSLLVIGNPNTEVSNEANLAEKTITITSETTVRDLMEFLEQALGIDTSNDVPESPSVKLVDGKIRIALELGATNNLPNGFPPFGLQNNLVFTVGLGSLHFKPIQPIEGGSTSAELVVFDEEGAPIGVRVTTHLESRNEESDTYRWVATRAENYPPSNDDVVLGRGLLTFTDEGLVDTGETPTIRFARDSGQDLVIELDFGSVTGLPKLDSFRRPISLLNVHSQDGFPPGALQTFSISETGEIIGHFSQGLEKTLGQLQLATFSRPFWLKPVGHQLLSPTRRSGQPEQVSPGDPGVGTIAQEPPTIHKRHDFERGGGTRLLHSRSAQQPDDSQQNQEFDPLEIVWSNFRPVFRR